MASCSGACDHDDAQQGTLVQVGLGKMTEAQFAEFLSIGIDTNSHQHKQPALPPGGSGGDDSEGSGVSGGGRKQQEKKKKLPVYTAPPSGLCLEHVFYEHGREVEGEQYTPD